MSSENIVETDVLVIGGGTAGNFAAIKAREQGLDVTLVDKAYASKSGAGGATQTFWFVFSPELGMDFDSCMDALNVSCEYINSREWCEIVLKESWTVYQDLISWGLKFPPVVKGMMPPFASIPMHGVHREHVPVMRKHAEKIGVNFMDRIVVTDLLKQDGNIVGAIGFPVDRYDLHIFKTKATVLSAGSGGFRPPGFEVSMQTGDADAMAYRAGAEITGKEFPDCHLTTARWPAYHQRPPGVNTDIEGERMPSHVTLWKEFKVHAGKGPILLDLDAAADERMTAMREIVMHDEWDAKRLEKMGVEVSRGGKYQLAGGTYAGGTNHGNAGIWIDNTKCATGLPGLYAAGDCCGTRLLGGVQTAVGGLAPAAITGRRAGVGAAEYALHAKKPAIDEEELTRLKKILYTPAERKGGFSPRWVTQLLKNTMMPYFVLYIKHEKRLQAALTIVEFLRDHLVPKLTAEDAHELRLAHETKNMVLNAEMILRAALFRTESRGNHYREDYPRRDDPNWLMWVKWKDEKGEMKPSKEPIPKEWWPDLSRPYEERYPVRYPGE